MGKVKFLMNVYFDNAATTRPHPKVIEVIKENLSDNFGNPSSVHSFGRRTRVLIEEARETIANFIGADSSEIYFTSGGTESNNSVIYGIPTAELKESGRNKIILSKADHHSIIDSADNLAAYGITSEFLPVNADTIVESESLRNFLDDSTSFVSIIHINNETGSINDIKSLAQFCKNKNVYFHTDAVQSFAKIPISVQDLAVDSLTASSHKIYGPKGAGFTYIRSGTPFEPLITGGSQERNRRGGTENVASIIGLAEAVRIAQNEMKHNIEHVSRIKSEFVNGLRNIDQDGIILNGGANAHPYILSITFKADYYRNDAEAFLMFLDINGVAASNGAACTSGTLKPSHVILASGKSEADAKGTIRFSFSMENTLEEVNYTLEVLLKLAKKFRI